MGRRLGLQDFFQFGVQRVGLRAVECLGYLRAAGTSLQLAYMRATSELEEL